MKIYSDDLGVEINGVLKYADVDFDMEEDRIDTVYHVWIYMKNKDGRTQKVDALEFMDEGEIRERLEKKRKENYCAKCEESRPDATDDGDAICKDCLQH